MANTMTKEEHARKNRRRSRQFIGALAILVILVGLATIVTWGVALVNNLLDDSERRAEFQDRLSGLVMLDPLPFDSIEQADSTLLVEAAIWGIVYRENAAAGSLDAYERDPETDCVILPALEVNAYISQLVGPDYTVENHSFETDDMNYLYNEERAGYLVPITSQVALYTAQVEQLQMRSGRLYVTVGYIPTATTTTDLTLTTPTDPVKYMDYVFDRGENRVWYLSALQESEMKPAVSTALNADLPDYDETYDPTEALQSAINSGAVDSSVVAALSGETAASESGESAEEEAASDSDEADSDSSGTE